MKLERILFVMCDQLRWDYLSCYGHPHLHTPNIDSIAARGVAFDRAYVQSPICGPSRMSFYTGRYVISHGSTWNGVPLKVGELTLGDHLRPQGTDAVLIGKTHMKADAEGMERYGIAPDSIIGARVAECGFDAYERDDGLHPDSDYAPPPRYNRYLRERGYDGDNPWHTHANSAEPEAGASGSGWFMRNASKPARIAEADSETPYLTRRFMDFANERDSSRPWLCHLSYIKPHWPYIVPEPYNSMYGPDAWLPPVRNEAERADPHPVLQAFMNMRASRSFVRDEVREAVLPAYMGLIKQIDDQIGALLGFLRERNMLDSTMIVFTSDHGDYLGDHWLGEKELFHDPSVRIPLIISDPRPEADATRGTRCAKLVEAIDLAPTFLEAFGGAPVPHRLEGKSLCPLLRGEDPDTWREVAFSEYDYSLTQARRELKTGPEDSRLIMAFDGRYKCIFAPGFAPMLYDLQEDPQELADLGRDPSLAPVRKRLKDAVLEWACRLRQRTTLSHETIAAAGQGREERAGIYIGYWSEDELGTDEQA